MERLATAPEPFDHTDGVTVTPAGRIEPLFYCFAALLIYGVLFMGMPISQARIPDRQHRDIFLLATGILGILAAWLSAPQRYRTREARILAAAALAIPGYAAFQILPLPLFLIRVLSPVRAQLVDALGPVTGAHRFASISIVPAATLTHFILLSAYCVIFFAAWRFAASAREKAWVMATPIVLAAAIEAVLGLLQLSAGSAQTVQGTYAIKNHFSGLLEMALPFPAVYAFSEFRQAPPWGYIDAPVAGRIAASVSLTILLAAGILISLSRGGLVAAMTSVLVMAAVATNWNMPMGRKIATACLFLLLAAIALFYMTPMALIARFSEHNTAGRYSVWSEAVGIIGQYPLVGCGLGGFESAFLRFKTIEGALLVDYAHNDYLQSLAELGIAGFLPVALLIGAVGRRAIRITDEAADIRWLGVASVGSLTAIVVHSAADFNLYVAANAAVLAWICGLTAGIKTFNGTAGRAVGAESIIQRGSVSPSRPMQSR